MNMKIPKIVWEDGKPLEEKTKLNLGVVMLGAGIVAMFYPFIVVVVGILGGLFLLSKTSISNKGADGIQKALEESK